MIKFDKIVFNVIFGMVMPIMGFIGFWWGSLLFTEEPKLVLTASLSGLCLGIIASLLIKYIYRPDIYKMPVPVSIIVYLFYCTGAFGFLMGVPVLVLIPGIFTGFYWAKRLIYNNISALNYKREISRVSIFTSIVAGIGCVASATIALLNKSTASELKHMLRLPFDISQTALVVFIITAGLFLIIVQYFLTRITMQQTLK